MTQAIAVPQAQRVQGIPSENGVVALNTNTRLTPTEIVGLLQKALQSPYTGRDPKKLGMTKVDAAFLSLAEKAQDGDGEEFDRLLNRLLGKPVQQVNQLSVSASLSEFLNVLSHEIEKENVIEVEAEVDPFGD